MEYALLLYATMGTVVRKRLTVAELTDLCPWLDAPFCSSPHCLDQGNQVIELVRVDLGGPADHVARKTKRDIRSRRQLEHFDRFVQSGRFRLVVITGTPEKSAAIRQAMNRHDWPRGLAIRLAVVPQLLTIVGSSSDAR